MKLKGMLSEKEKLSNRIKRLAEACQSLEELSKAIEKQGMVTYHRKGVLTGVWLGGRKYRLTTIGVGKEHLKQLTLEQQRLRALEMKKQLLGKDVERER